MLYFWHNDIAQIAELLETIKHRTNFVFTSFCIWDKGKSYRAVAWKNRSAEQGNTLRSWYNVCEYCLHFFNAPKGENTLSVKVGHAHVLNTSDTSERFDSLKKWYAAELKRLGITQENITGKYTEVTGRKPHMLRHYFQDSQFEIPTKEVWENVYKPLGFKMEYEELRTEFESLRNYHKCAEDSSNVWHVPQIPTANRLHTCQKPVEILERLINASCPENGTVLDCFMGSGSTGVACANTARNFIGVEKTPAVLKSQKRE